MENNELKKEISMKGNDKDRIEYYLRLRKELLEEIERIKNDKIAQEIYFNTEMDKLREDVAFMTEKCEQKDKDILQFQKSGPNSPLKSNLDDDFFSTERSRLIELKSDKDLNNKVGSSPPNRTSSKYFQNLCDNELVSNFSEDNFFMGSPGADKQFLTQNSGNFDKKNQDKDIVTANMGMSAFQNTAL